MTSWIAVCVLCITVVTDSVYASPSPVPFTVWQWLGLYFGDLVGSPQIPSSMTSVKFWRIRSNFGVSTQGSTRPFGRRVFVDEKCCWMIQAFKAARCPRKSSPTIRSQRRPSPTNTFMSACPDAVEQSSIPSTRLCECCFPTLYVSFLPFDYSP